jgi:hypothetical protein
MPLRKRDFKWTSERVDLLTKLVNEGASTSDIMRQVGVKSRNSIHGKVHRLGLCGIRGQPCKKDKPKRVVSKIFVRAHRQLAPCDPPVPIELPNPLIVYGPRQCSILGLRLTTCRWPLGGFGEPVKLYCGAQTLLGCVYCAEHAGLAFTPLQTRKKHAFSSSTIPHARETFDDGADRVRIVIGPGHHGR